MEHYERIEDIQPENSMALDLIFVGQSNPVPKTLSWKIRVPFEFEYKVTSEMRKIYGEDVKYSICPYMTIDVYKNEDDSNLTTGQVLKIHSSPYKPKEEKDIL